MAHVHLLPAGCEPEFADERRAGDWVAALPSMLALPQLPPWCSYAARTDGRVVGFGGFKGQPDENGAVELGYLTLLPDRGRGVANAICAGLVAIAFSSGASAVLADMQPEENASTGVPRKQQFRFVGERIDPEVGLVWRWILSEKTMR